MAGELDGVHVDDGDDRLEHALLGLGLGQHQRARRTRGDEQDEHGEDPECAFHDSRSFSAAADGGAVKPPPRARCRSTRLVNNSRRTRIHEMRALSARV